MARAASPLLGFGYWSAARQRVCGCLPGCSTAIPDVTVALHRIPRSWLQGIEDTILASDGMCGLLVLENAARCGEGCDAVRAAFEAVQWKSGGLFKFAYTHGSDIILGAGGQPMEVRQQFNLTEIPALIIFPPGPKHLAKGMAMPAASTLALARQGPKGIYENLRMFMPSLVGDVRGHTFGKWLRGPAPLVPRLLLFSDKSAKDAALPFKALSAALASRVLVAQTTTRIPTGAAKPTDASLAAAFGITSNAPALFLSGPAPRAALTAAGSGGAPADDELLLDSLQPGELAAAWTPYPGNLSTATYDQLVAFVVAGTRGAAPVSLLSGPDDFEAACGAGDVTVCFIAVLPHDEMVRARGEVAARRGAAAGADADANADGGVLDPAPWSVLQRAAQRAYLRLDWDTLVQRRGPLDAVRLPIAWAAVDAHTQAAFAVNLKAGGPGPALVALNPRKRVFATLGGGSGGGFTEEKLHAFVMAAMDQAAPQAAAAAAARGKPGGDDDDAETSRIVFESLPTLPVLKQEAAAAAPGKAKAKARTPGSKPAAKKKVGGGGSAAGKGKGGAAAATTTVTTSDAAAAGSGGDGGGEGGGDVGAREL